MYVWLVLRFIWIVLIHRVVSYLKEIPGLVWIARDQSQASLDVHQSKHFVAKINLMFMLLVVTPR